MSKFFEGENAEKDEATKLLKNVVTTIRNGMNSNGDEVTRVLLRTLPDQGAVVAAITEIDGPQGALMDSYNAGGVDPSGNKDTDSITTEVDDDDIKGKEDDSLSGRLAKLLNNTKDALAKYLSECLKEGKNPDLNLINEMIELIAKENEQDLNSNDKDKEAEKFSGEFRDTQQGLKDLAESGMDNDSYADKVKGMKTVNGELDPDQLLSALLSSKNTKSNGIKVALNDGGIQEKNNEVLLTNVSRDVVEKIMESLGQSITSDSNIPTHNAKPSGPKTIS